MSLINYSPWQDAANFGQGFGHSIAQILMGQPQLALQVAGQQADIQRQNQQQQFQQQKFTEEQKQNQFANALAQKEYEMKKPYYEAEAQYYNARPGLQQQQIDINQQKVDRPPAIQRAADPTLSLIHLSNIAKALSGMQDSGAAGIGPSQYNPTIQAILGSVTNAMPQVLQQQAPSFQRPMRTNAPTSNPPRPGHVKVQGPDGSTGDVPQGTPLPQGWQVIN